MGGRNGRPSRAAAMLGGIAFLLLATIGRLFGGQQPTPPQQAQYPQMVRITDTQESPQDPAQGAAQSALRGGAGSPGPDPRPVGSSVLAGRSPQSLTAAAAEIDEFQGKIQDVGDLLNATKNTVEAALEDAQRDSSR